MVLIKGTPWKWFASRRIEENKAGYKGHRFCKEDNDEDEKYAVVSHVWGNPCTIVSVGKENHKVLLNSNEEKRGWIGTLADDTIDLPVWIDIYSIDQSDADDKAYQIDHMDLIFKRSSRCYIFIQDSANVIDHFISISKGEIGVQSVAEKSCKLAKWGDHMSNVMDDTIHSTRLWTLQEYVNSVSKVYVLSRDSGPKGIKKVDIQCIEEVLINANLTLRTEARKTNSISGILQFNKGIKQMFGKSSHRDLANKLKFNPGRSVLLNRKEWHKQKREERHKQHKNQAEIRQGARQEEAVEDAEKQADKHEEAAEEEQAEEQEEEKERQKGDDELLYSDVWSRRFVNSPMRRSTQLKDQVFGCHRLVGKGLQLDYNEESITRTITEWLKYLVSVGCIPPKPLTIKGCQDKESAVSDENLLPPNASKIISLCETIETISNNKDNESIELKARLEDRVCIALWDIYREEGEMTVPCSAKDNELNLPFTLFSLYKLFPSLSWVSAFGIRDSVIIRFSEESNSYIHHGHYTKTHKDSTGLYSTSQKHDHTKRLLYPWFYSIARGGVCVSVVFEGVKGWNILKESSLYLVVPKSVVDYCALVIASNSDPKQGKIIAYIKCGGLKAFTLSRDDGIQLLPRSIITYGTIILYSLFEPLLLITTVTLTFLMVFALPSRKDAAFQFDISMLIVVLNFCLLFKCAIIDFKSMYTRLRTEGAYKFVKRAKMDDWRCLCGILGFLVALIEFILLGVAVGISFQSMVLCVYIVLRFPGVNVVSYSMALGASIMITIDYITGVRTIKRGVM
ncbi:hypothetical protein HK096_006273 [Nowakowskiella sp. JEL0078]|nr:hypothetical protein HK096_006273 [Nowakowskiella sp. JEL0078]